MPLSPRGIARKPRLSDSPRQARCLPRPRFFRRLLKRTSWTTPKPAPGLSQRKGSAEHATRASTHRLRAPGTSRGAWREVTDTLRQSKQALHASQHRLAEAFRAARMCAWDWDGAADHVLTSASASEVFGLLSGEVIDSSDFPFRWIHPDDLETYRQLVRRAEEDGTSWHGEYRIIRPRDGKLAWLEERARVERDPASGRLRLTGLTWDITERKRAEEALRQARDALEARAMARTAELAQSNERLSAEVTERNRAEAARTELLRKLTIAQEDERRHLSRELHDGLGQEVTALVLGLKLIARHLPSGSLAQPGLSELVETVARIDREVHALAVQLRPPALDDLGLDAALTTYVEHWSLRTGVDVTFQNVGLHGHRLAAEVETALYRVVQEALNNVAKHAAAQRVSVLVQRTQSEILTVIEDDGCGFAPERLVSAGARSKLGLLGMRERMAYAGGSLCITSREGVGTTVRASIPLVMSEASGSAISPVPARTPSDVPLNG